jgi:hypothetical protein
VQPVTARPGRRDQTWAIVAIIVALGIVARVALYVSSPTLYIDEAMLALNLLLLSPADMFRPLLFEQIAPVSFSLAQQGVLAVAGASDYALRLLPVLCAIVVTAATPRVAQQFVSRRGVVIVAGLIAFSPMLLGFSFQIKPYSSDAAVTIALIALTIAAARRLESRWAWVALGVAGALAVTVSLPAVFILAGVGAYLAARTWKDRNPRIYLGLIALACVWLVPVWLLHTLVYTADPAINAYMDRFWQDAFVFSKADLSLPRQIAEFTGGTFEPLLGRDWARHSVAIVVTVGGFIIGAITLIRNRGADSFLIVVPLVCAWVAYALGFYVAVGRLLLFAAPLLAIVVAAGLDHVARLAVGRWRVVVATLLVLPIFWYQLRGASVTMYHLLRDNGGATREVLRVARADEPIYVYVRVLPQWIYYTTDWSAPDMERVRRLVSNAIRSGPNSGNTPPRGRPVVREGYDRVYPFRNSWEIIGIPDGFEWGPETALNASVDAGWGENEIDRIIRTGRSNSWALLPKTGIRVDAFVRAAEQRDACVTARDHRRLWMAIYKVEFPCPPGGAATQ